MTSNHSESRAETLTRVLADHYGTPKPADHPDDPFERLIRVALDQALDARQITMALDALRQAGLLSAEVLADADPVELVDAWQPLRIRHPEKLAAPIRKLAKWVVERHHGDARSLTDPDVSTSQLRDELLALNGVGSATADSILLHGLDRPSYPLDRATYRIFIRHGWLDSSADYEEARSIVESLAPDAAAKLAEFSEWFTRVGCDFCRATVPKCEKCPLKGMLPEGGVVDPGE